jgi:hypothetical protein
MNRISRAQMRRYESRICSAAVGFESIGRCCRIRIRRALQCRSRSSMCGSVNEG